MFAIHRVDDKDFFVSCSSSVGLSKRAGIVLLPVARLLQVPSHVCITAGLLGCLTDAEQGKISHRAHSGRPVAGRAVISGSDQPSSSQALSHICMALTDVLCPRSLHPFTCLVDEGYGRVAEAQDAIRLLVEDLARLPRLAAEHHRHLRHHRN